MFFLSKNKKSAKNLLAMAHKVYNYRCDLMPEDDVANFIEYIEELENLYKLDKIDTQEFTKTSDKLEKLMMKWGGKIYPLTSWVDNVETVIVAGILAIGIRSFFLQPFKIPTNSMYPSFYGMTPQIYESVQEAPALPEKIWRFIMKGASNYNLKAPKSGNLYVKINAPESIPQRGGIFDFDNLNYKYLGVWPTIERKYKFFVDNEEIDLVVPADFSLDKVITEIYPLEGVSKGDLSNYYKTAYHTNKVVERNGDLYLDLGKIEQGNYILNFDILTGDMLFVDRITYNFKKPKIGEPIVFTTKDIAGLTRLNGGVPDDKYYIKRLTGEGENVLSIKDNTLYIDGKKAEGSVAFEHMEKQSNNYCGYMPEGIFEDGKSHRVAKDNYFAMGDNSKNSLDSRYWGDLPKEAMVGKALIIFYPFTNRWGAVK